MPRRDAAAAAPACPGRKSFYFVVPIQLNSKKNNIFAGYYPIPFFRFEVGGRPPWLVMSVLAHGRRRLSLRSGAPERAPPRRASRFVGARRRLPGVSLFFWRARARPRSRDWGRPDFAAEGRRGRDGPRGQSRVFGVGTSAVRLGRSPPPARPESLVVTSKKPWMPCRRLELPTRGVCVGGAAIGASPVLLPPRPPRSRRGS